MGSLGDVTGGNLALMLPVITAGLVLSVAVIKPLNLLLLGENYARTMGLNVQRTRTLLFLSTVLLAGTVTAFCGPVGFIGLAVPHLARMLFASADHRVPDARVDAFRRGPAGLRPYFQIAGPSRSTPSRP